MRHIKTIEEARELPEVESTVGYDIQWDHDRQVQVRVPVLTEACCYPVQEDDIMCFEDLCGNIKRVVYINGEPHKILL